MLIHHGSVVWGCSGGTVARAFFAANVRFQALQAQDRTPRSISLLRHYKDIFSHSITNYEILSASLSIFVALQMPSTEEMAAILQFPSTCRSSPSEIHADISNTALH